MESTANRILDTKTLVLCALILIGIVLTIVGLFGGFIKDVYSNKSLTLKEISDRKDYLEEESSLQWFSITNAFAWCAFGFVIATVFASVAIAYYKVQNGEKLVFFLAFFTIVFACLAFGFSIKMVREYGGVGRVAYGPLLLFFGAILVSFACFLMKRVFAVNSAELILCIIILSGFVLTTVGLSGTFLKLTEGKESLPLTIAGISFFNQEASDPSSRSFELGIEGFAVVNAFAWISFVLSLFCLFAFVAVMLFNTKYVPVAKLIGTLTLVFSILTLIFSISMQTNSNENYKEHNESASFLLSYGPFLMAVGGLLAGGGTIRFETASVSVKNEKIVCKEEKDETLQKMKDLVEAGIMSEEQYEEKKKKLTEQKRITLASADIDANLSKLNDLVNAGILSEEQFKEKKKELEKQKYAQNAEYLTVEEIISNLKQMKELVNGGILTREEFEMKKAELKPLKRLREMVDGGVISQEEYEAKKAEIAKIYE